MVSEKTITVDICIITFRRPPLLKKLLESMQLLDVDGRVDCRIIVVDNDIDRSAENVVSEMSYSSKFPIIYDVEPVQNIALARNKALSLSGSQHVAFVDDDEYVDSDWLKQHMRSFEKFTVEVSFGPVVPVYEEGVPGWVVKGGFFERKRHPDGTIVTIGGTGNSCFKRYAIERIGLKFNKDFGLTGGEDTEFFSSLCKSGSRYVWTDSAVVYERVPRSRATAKWLIRRAFRGGQAYARIYVPKLTTTLKVCWFLKRTILVVGLTVGVLGAILLGKIVFVKTVQKLVSNIGQISYCSKQYYKEYEADAKQ